jgi:hypothetical protein
MATPKGSMSTEVETLQVSVLSYRCSICAPLVTWHMLILTVSADGPSQPVRFPAHRQPLCCNFMYHSRIVLSVGGSVRYTVRNLLRTVTSESVLRNSKTQNAYLFPVHAMFHHDCSLAVKPASTPRRLGQKKNLERFSAY